MRYSAGTPAPAAAGGEGGGGTGPKRCCPQHKNSVVVSTWTGAVNKEPRGRHQLRQSDRVATGHLLFSLF